MRSWGQTKAPAIIVIPNGKGFQTLDGVHRLLAAKKLGQKTISCYVPVKKK
jgi:ParB-like chromosome segregation protein Spo0J